MKRKLGILLCLLFLLSGCGQEPAVQTASTETTAVETTETAVENMTDEEKAVAQCRAVLDTVQSGDSYHITLTRWYDGIYSDTVQIEYCRNGDDRAMISKRTEENVDGQPGKWEGTAVKVCKDGVTYSGFSADNIGIEWEGQIQDELEFDPWLYTFDWDAQEVELLEILKTAEGRSVSFQVHAVYDINYGFAEDYTITFYFDEEGNFIERELIATGQETTPTYRDVDGEWVRLKPDDPGVEKTGRIITRIDHVTVESLDPEEIGAAIDLFWQDAVACGQG